MSIFTERVVQLPKLGVGISGEFNIAAKGIDAGWMKKNYPDLIHFYEYGSDLERGLGLKLEFTDFHMQLYQLAFIEGDAAGLQQQLDWSQGKPDNYVALNWQTGAAIVAGQWQRAQEFSRQAINLAPLGENHELAARYATEQALRNAVMGDCRGSRASVTQGLNFGRGRLPLARAPGAARPNRHRRSWRNSPNVSLKIL